jgi:hypothetical protein
MVVPTSVAIVGSAGPAFAASAITCSSLKGTVSSTVTISMCTPFRGKGYKSASAPATSLLGGGNLKWSTSGATTTVGNTSVTTVTPNKCGSSTEYSFTGKVTAASTSGRGIPAVGDRVSGKACVSSAGNITLLKGTTLKL